MSQRIKPWILSEQDVAALRHEANTKGPNAMLRLADSHERLRAENDRLRRALREGPPPPRTVPHHIPGPCDVTEGDNWGLDNRYPEELTDDA